MCKHDGFQVDLHSMSTVLDLSHAIQLALRLDVDPQRVVFAMSCGPIALHCADAFLVDLGVTDGNVRMSHTHLRVFEYRSGWRFFLFLETSAHFLHSHAPIVFRLCVLIVICVLCDVEIQDVWCTPITSLQLSRRPFRQLLHVLMQKGHRRVMLLQLSQLQSTQQRFDP
jgi:hypothetical protein